MNEHRAAAPYIDVAINESDKPSREFSVGETLFAWFALLAGYIFCRAFPVWLGPLGAFLLVILLFAASTLVLLKRGMRPGGLSITVAISAIIVACALPLSSGAMIQTLASGYALAAWLYYVYSACGNSLETGFTDFLAIDFFKALLMPFSSMGLLFRALFYGRATGCGKFLLKLLAGVLIALVPTALVLGNLSYDAGFSALLSRIFDFDDMDIISHTASIVFGIPVGMYFFGALISSEDRKMGDIITAEGCKKAAVKLRVSPVVTAVAACLPILFLYVVFFISQWSYYVSGFTGVLPEGFSYARYAVEGFFQLCTVSVINLVILAALAVFMKRGKGGSTFVFKLLSLIFSLFTLVLITTAFAKLVMYIDYYGLTPKRVYAAWFMAVIALIFILIAVKQFAARLNVVALSMAVAVVMFAGLSLVNPNSLIARYNVDRYLEGSLATVDIDAMEELGLAAVPEMVQLMDELEEQGDKGDMYNGTVIFLVNMKMRFIHEDGIFDMNLPWIRARKALGDVYLQSTNGYIVGEW